MEDLGPVLSTHKGRIAAGGYFWYVSTLMIVFGGWAVVSAPFSGDWSRAGSGVLGVGVACVLLLYPIYTLLQTLTVYQNGFVWTRLLRAPLVVRWADVAGMQKTIEHSRRALHMKGTHVELDITLRSGEHVVVTNDLDGIEQLEGYLHRSAQQAAAPMPGGAPPGAAPPSPWG